MSTYLSARVPDQQLFKAMVAIAESLKEQTASLVVHVGDSQHSWPLNKAMENAEFASVLEEGGSLFDKWDLSVNTPYHCTIHVRRDVTTLEVSYSTPGNASATAAAKMSKAVQSVLPPFERSDALEKLLGEDISEFYRQRDHALLRLEDVAQHIIERNEAYREELDARLARETEKLQARTKADEERLALEHQARLKVLLEKEAALAAEKSDIDDRGSKHARRQIRKELKDEIAKRGEKFTLTPKTVSKRYIIHAVFGVLILFLIGMAVHAALHLTGSGTDLIYPSIRLSLLSIGAVVALIYYIRWNDDWFRRHADEEFALKRLMLDFERANWVVEMGMEWRDEKHAEIPAQMLEPLTAGLFATRNDAKAPRHPMEHLTEVLLGASAGMEMDLPGGVKLKLDKGGCKKLIRETKSEA